MNQLTKRETSSVEKENDNPELQEGSKEDFKLRNRRPLGVPTAISADLLRPLPRGMDALLLSIVGMVAALILWSAFAEIEETTKGEGRVIPASKIQVVQNLEGGIVREILVREGQHVEAGSILLRIDPTLAGSSHGEKNERILGLRALVARLQAEVNNEPLTFPEELVTHHPKFVLHQHREYNERKRELEAVINTLNLQAKQRAQERLELEAKIETLKRALEIAKSELEILKPLVETRSVSRSVFLQAQGKLNDTQGALRAAQLALPRVIDQRLEALSRRKEKETAFRAEALEKLAKANIEIRALSEANKGAFDKLSRTTVRAPATGIVKTVNVTTKGQVIKPGSDLIEIVPLNDTLLVEARIRPQDIAFLHPGQEAIVKLTAYDFSLYGGLEGRLERIAADSTTNDKGETFYLIQVRTSSNTLKSKGEKLRVIPGMVAEVNILTGAKTVLQYLIKPLTRMRHNALTER